MADEEEAKPEKPVKKTKPEVLVVSQLPVETARQITDDKGVVYECFTMEEALTELLQLVREIKKSVA